MALCVPYLRNYELLTLRLPVRLPSLRANNISCGYVLQLVSKPMITDLDQRNRWEEEEERVSRLGDTLA